MKKVVIVFLVVASGSISFAKQECIGTCSIYDKTERTQLSRKSMVSVAKDAKGALQDMEWKCFDLGHELVPYGHASSRDIENFSCKTVKSN